MSTSPLALHALNPPASSKAVPMASRRLASIDMLRGLIILFMLLDHVRDTFFLHLQVADPMDVNTTSPELFFSRILAHICAPVFIFLTGLSAYLYASKKNYPKKEAALFLFKRGLFLIFLEITLVNFAWTFQFPPSKVFLQVIWVIGLSMLALSVLLWLPRWLLVTVGLVIIAGHNLLDGLTFSSDHVFHIPWAILHERGWIVLSDMLRFRTSYPLLPWIGVIALGYAAGPWFMPQVSAQKRSWLLLISGLILLTAFVVLRLINVYGDAPWVIGQTPVLTLMSFFNLTKYPPSLLFLLLTLGIGLLLLRFFEQHMNRALFAPLAVFGSAPMFFYLLHLYALRLMYLGAQAIWGNNQGEYFGFSSVWQLWLACAVLALLLYYPVRAFAQFKAQHKEIAWLKYL